MVLGVIVLSVCTKKLRNIGGDLGGAVKGFKEGMKSEGDAAKQVDAQHASTIEGEVKDKNSTHA